MHSILDVVVASSLSRYHKAPLAHSMGCQSKDQITRVQFLTDPDNAIFAA